MKHLQNRKPYISHKIIAHNAPAPLALEESTSEIISPDHPKLATFRQSYKNAGDERKFVQLVSVMQTFGLSLEAMIVNFTHWSNQKLEVNMDGGRLGTHVGSQYPRSNAMFVHEVAGHWYHVFNERQTPDGLYPIGSKVPVTSRWLHTAAPLDNRYGRDTVERDGITQTVLDSGFNRVFDDATYDEFLFENKILHLDELIKASIARLRSSGESKTFLDNVTPVAHLGSFVFSLHVFNAPMTERSLDNMDAVLFPLVGGVHIRSPFGFVETADGSYSHDVDGFAGLPIRSNFSVAPVPTEDNSPVAALALWYVGKIDFRPPEVMIGCTQPTSNARKLAQQPTLDLPGTTFQTVKQTQSGKGVAYSGVLSPHGIMGATWTGPLNTPFSMSLKDITHVQTQNDHLEPANWELVRGVFAAVVRGRSGVYNLFESPKTVRIAKELLDMTWTDKTGNQEPMLAPKLILTRSPNSAEKPGLEDLQDEILDFHSHAHRGSTSTQENPKQENLPQHDILPKWAQAVITEFLKHKVVHPYNHDNILEVGWVRPQKSGGWGGRGEHKIHIHPREAGHGHILQHALATRDVYLAVETWLSENSSQVSSATDVAKAAASLEEHLKATFK